MIEVFLADDHQIFRQGLRTMLEKSGQVKVVGEAGDGQEAVRRVEELRPDVAILDVAMPGLEGIDVAKRLTKSCPDTKILMLSMHADRFYATEALKAGALGYLLKEESFDQLLAAITAVSKKKIFLSPALEVPVMEDFVKLARQGSQKSKDLLTNREREILKLVAEGMTNQEVANLLCISSSTVDTHRKKIMAKLDIHSVAGLVKYAIRHKIVSI
jgi:DNA-binding NarL/FixJ family response regulator